MHTLTIKAVVISVLEKANKPLSSQEIYEQIIADNLYSFKAKKPENVLKSVIRKNCEGLSLKTGNKDKCFVAHQNGSYSLIK